MSQQALTPSEALIIALQNIAESNNRIASEIAYLRQNLQSLKEAGDTIKNLVNKIDLLKGLSGILK